MSLKQMEATSVTIGDNKFYIRPFPAFKAANISGELASTLTPFLGAIAPLAKGAGDGHSGESEGIMDMDVDKAAKALMNCPDISGDKVERLMKKLLLGGHIAVETEDEDGEKESEKLNEDLVNELFCGDVQEMFVLCVHVIRLNFRGFFDKFAALSGKAKLPKAAPMRKIM